MNILATTLRSSRKKLQRSTSCSADDPPDRVRRVGEHLGAENEMLTVLRTERNDRTSRLAIPNFSVRLSKIVLVCRNFQNILKTFTDHVAQPSAEQLSGSCRTAKKLRAPMGTAATSGAAGVRNRALRGIRPATRGQSKSVISRKGIFAKDNDLAPPHPKSVKNHKTFGRIV